MQKGRMMRLKSNNHSESDIHTQKSQNQTKACRSTQVSLKPERLDPSKYLSNLKKIQPDSSFTFYTQQIDSKIMP